MDRKRLSKINAALAARRIEIEMLTGDDILDAFNHFVGVLAEHIPADELRTLSEKYDRLYAQKEPAKLSESELYIGLILWRVIDRLKAKL